MCSALMNGDSGQHGGTEEPLVVQAAALWPGAGGPGPGREGTGAGFCITAELARAWLPVELHPGPRSAVLQPAPASASCTPAAGTRGRGFTGTSISEGNMQFQVMPGAIWKEAQVSLSGNSMF